MISPVGTQARVVEIRDMLTTGLADENADRQRLAEKAEGMLTDLGNDLQAVIDMATAGGASITIDLGLVLTSDTAVPVVGRCSTCGKCNMADCPGRGFADEVGQPHGCTCS